MSYKCHIIKTNEIKNNIFAVFMFIPFAKWHLHVFQ